MAKKEEQPVNDREKVLEQAFLSIEKRFGKGSIMRMGQNEVVKVPIIPSGALNLDIAMGVGGYPRGRIVEIYGPEASGKTTLTLHAIAEAQKAGGIAAFIDAEHALDVTYARKLGVKTEDLLVAQPDYGEQALEIAETLVRSNAIDILVIDSVAALVPKAEIDGEMGDSHVGLQARLMSQAMRKLTSIVAKSQTCVMLTNQIRMKIGVLYGSPETTTGGYALKFYSTMRLDVRRINSIKRGEAVVGSRTRVKVVKNKLAPPFQEVEFDLIFGEGFSRPGIVVDMAVAGNIVEKSGAWYSYGEMRLGQGADNVRQFMEDNPDILAEVEQKVRAAHGLGDPILTPTQDVQ